MANVRFARQKRPFELDGRSLHGAYPKDFWRFLRELLPDLAPTFALVALSIVSYGHHSNTDAIIAGALQDLVGFVPVETAIAWQTERRTTRRRSSATGLTDAAKKSAYKSSRPKANRSTSRKSLRMEAGQRHRQHSKRQQRALEALAGNRASLPSAAHFIQ